LFHSVELAEILVSGKRPLNPSIRIDPEADDESPACKSVLAWLRDHNWDINPDLMKVISDPASKEPINLVARLGDEVVGGLFGFTQSKWLRIEIMAVAPAHRRCGIGASLLAQAEQIARSRGCVHAYVDTLEHQAPDFYTRQGYAASGMIADWDSRGNSKYFLTRDLE
jgi:GNAT superfamily N-acetyltransferase